VLLQLHLVSVSHTLCKQAADDDCYTVLWKISWTLHDRAMLYAYPSSSTYTLSCCLGLITLHKRHLSSPADDDVPADPR
jgi:hypothetical protein